MDKQSNQKVTERHGNKEKLEPCLANTETHRRALATVKRGRRQYCRPRGRTTVCSETQRSQAPRTGRLASQGTGGAMTRFAKTGRALPRRCKLDGAERQCREKQGRENGEERRLLRLYSAAKNQVEATQEPSPRQRGAESGHGGDWNAIEARRR